MPKRREVWDGTFREYVLALRERTGMSQGALARALGIGQNTVARWESSNPEQSREARGLTRDALTRYARARGMPDPPPRRDDDAQAGDSESGLGEE